MKKDIYMALGFTALLIISAVPLSFFSLHLINFIFSKLGLLAL
ncbi:hypothetical protein [Crenothrix polyspora]|uniref:Uncharacterized protein n=1 Tax=Crenothrix polyspora TaxID=360316 RepID=A0A1R4HBS8_9GAMM|nr:hypothetical protein [Crenothrix polyspora]SJM93669.1 hypothetical protein CRENPOLYSF1_450027 [Crenothrix polyspora]